MKKNRFTLLLVTALSIFCSCKDKEDAHDTLSKITTELSDPASLKKFIHGATDNAYRQAYFFINSQLSVENIILSNRYSISYDSDEIEETLRNGFEVLRDLNYIEDIVHDHKEYVPDMSDIYALKAFVYYNMAMLSGKTSLPDIRDRKNDIGRVTYINAPEIYSYCQELLSKCDLSHQEKDRLFNTDAIKLLIAEIALMQKNKEKALDYIYKISDINRNIFALKNENSIIPIYTKKTIALLKEEAEGKTNSQAWYDLGVSYGIWAALKRQGTARKYTQSWREKYKETMTGFTDNDGIIIELEERGFKRTKRDIIEKITYDYFPNFIKFNNVTYTLIKNSSSDRTDGKEIIKAVYSNENGSPESICDFLYEGNRISQIVKQYATGEKDIVNIKWSNDNTIIKVESNIHGAKKICTYTYTDYPTGKFIAFEGTNLKYCIPSLLGVDPYLFMQGYYGKYPCYLVKTAMVNGESVTNTYERDENGNVLKVTNTKGYTATFTWK